MFVVLLLLVQSIHASTFTQENVQRLHSPDSNATSCYKSVYEGTGGQDEIEQKYQHTNLFFNNPEQNELIFRCAGSYETTLSIVVNKHLAWTSAPSPFATITYTRRNGEYVDKETCATLTTAVPSTSRTRQHQRVICLAQGGETQLLFSLPGGPPPIWETCSYLKGAANPQHPQTLFYASIVLPIISVCALQFCVNPLQLHEVILTESGRKMVIDFTNTTPHVKKKCDPIPPPCLSSREHRQDFSFQNDSVLCHMTSEQNFMTCAYSVLFMGKITNDYNTFEYSKTLAVRASTHTAWSSKKVVLATCTYAYTNYVYTNSERLHATLLLEGVTKTSDTYQVIATLENTKEIIIDSFTQQTPPISQAYMMASYAHNHVHNPENSTLMCNIQLSHATIQIVTKGSGSLAITKVPLHDQQTLSPETITAVVDLTPFKTFSLTTQPS